MGVRAQRVGSRRGIARVQRRFCLATADRKDDHIRINLEEDVGFQELTTGLERYRFVHQALPEVDLAEIDTEVVVFGKNVAAPILVSSMTGGTEQAGILNRRLAEAVEARGLAMGVGSQRAALEDNDAVSSFSVRVYAPTALLFANLGAVQLNYGYTVDQCRRAVDMLEADALILHLNALQEAVQPEGDTRWRGLLSRIGEVCASVGVPVIAKEVGWGISNQVALRLIQAGVSAIDVAGAGGTSWSEVEKHRATSERQRRLAAAFREWGIPTATSLAQVRAAREDAGRPELPIFASGGIRSGQDVAKAVALGADLVGLASPFLRRAKESTESVLEEFDLVTAELRTAMFASACRDIASLRQSGVLARAGEVVYGRVSQTLGTPDAVQSDRQAGQLKAAHPIGGNKGSSRAATRAQNEDLGDSSLERFASTWLPLLDKEMKLVLAARHPALADHYGMMQYHMGWADDMFRPSEIPAGKRIRPLLCLLACDAVGGDPAGAIPAAAAVEILHNFSLVHDDIEDGDETRRHRPTLWALWGVPQAINAGDGMFALAHAALLRAWGGFGTDAAPSFERNQSVLETLGTFTETCISLTEGQHLDLSYEGREVVTVAEYLRMIEGKTAALIAGSVTLGALFGGAEAGTAESLGRFGRNIGLAFQIQDDILGIWGDPDATGKAAGNDFLRRKKSLPLLFALENVSVGEKMKSLWRDRTSEEMLPEALRLLDSIDARGWSEEQARNCHRKGMQALNEALGEQTGSSLLLKLANRLLQRQR